MSGRIGLALSLIGLCAVPASTALGDCPAFRFAGYLPDYRAKAFDLDAAKGLTDLIVFSATVTADGGIDRSGLKRVAWDKLRAFKTRQRVRLILCVGGWGRSGDLAAVATSAEKRQACAKAAVRLCLDERLDGLDFDWEYPKNEDEQKGYADLLTELSGAFRPHGLVLSVTVSARQKLPKSAFEAVDWVQVMAYDHAGRHSTLDDAKADVRSLLDRGVPPEKIVLGVPFYGRDMKQREKALTYREIVARHHPEPGTDEVAGVYFNGPATIRAKTEYALESKLGGVMVWELGQDAGGEQSLLRTIRETVDRRRGPAGP